MGCDIHLFVEHLDDDNIWRPQVGEILDDWNRQYVNKKRINADRLFQNMLDMEYPLIHFFNDRLFRCNGEDEIYTAAEQMHNFLDELNPLPLGIGYNFADPGRNYSLFSILANVRNGYGFAGVDTGDGFMPISMPKGLPHNVSDMVAEQSDSWGVDGHSHSFLSVRELDDYEWNNQHTIKRGYVNAEQYREFLKNGMPSQWSGEVWGGNVTHVTNREMEDLIASGKSTESVYTQVEWPQSYCDCVGFFYKKILPALKAIDEDFNRTRIVFWFDN